MKKNPKTDEQPKLTPNDLRYMQDMAEIAALKAQVKVLKAEKVTLDLRLSASEAELNYWQGKAEYLSRKYIVTGALDSRDFKLVTTLGVDLPF